MSRTYCSRCAYPESSCLCSAINETQFKTRIVVLQHPSEVKHAKNTARLISLVVPEAEIVVGETPEDFHAVRSRLETDPHAVLLYPAAESSLLSTSAEGQTIRTIVILDGTWRKAKKIWLSNTWLHEMRVCHLDEPESNYRIRSTRIPGGLASIEAAAHALRQLGEANTEALLDAFAALQDKWPSNGRA